MSNDKNLFAIFGPDGAALAELKGLIREFDEKYLSKDQTGTASKLITFLKGINIGEYVKGISGGAFTQEEGGSYIEVDNLKVRKRASFKEQFIAFKNAFCALMIIVIVIGGSYGGIFTPTVRTKC